jgi:hypothetical protein
MSVISNPATAKTILLDHLKKTATIQPTPPAALAKPAMPQMPGFSPPSMPGQPQVPGVKVEDLGKSVLQGHEVEGKRFVMPQVAPPKLPAFKVPGMPKMPQMPGTPVAGLKPPQAPGMPAAGLKPPQIPGMPGLKLPQVPGMPPVGLKPPQIPGMPAPGLTPPQAPGMPATPAAAHGPATTEVWNSTKMGVPMLTKMSGGFGQLTQVCHRAVPGEPHPSTFHIPQGYKVSGKSF